MTKFVRPIIVCYQKCWAIGHCNCNWCKRSFFYTCCLTILWNPPFVWNLCRDFL